MGTFRFIALGWLTFAPAVTFAHEDLHERIAALDRQISASATAPLLIRRADLHRRHQDWDRALRDFAAAEALAPDDPALAPGRAQVHLDRGAPREALGVLDALEEETAGKGLILLLRARALAAAGETAAASTTYAAATERLATPRPEHFLEHAALLAAAEPADPEGAIAVIDRGVARLGGLLSIQVRALEIERGAGLLEAALRRTRHIAADAAAGPQWRVVESEILLELKRCDEARKVARDVIDKLRRLPTRRRSTPGIRELERRAAAVLDRTGDGAAP